MSPAVLAATGWHYSQNKQYAEPASAFAAYIVLSPDYWAYDALAANFKAQGKIDRWQTTLDDFLKKVEDPGLDTRGYVSKSPTTTWVRLSGARPSRTPKTPRPPGPSGR